MVAYKKNSLNGAETDFSKFESRELPQFMKQNLASTCFFRITPYLQLNWLDWKYEPRRSKKKISTVNNNENGCFFVPKRCFFLLILYVD